MYNVFNIAIAKEAARADYANGIALFVIARHLADVKLCLSKTVTVMLKNADIAVAVDKTGEHR